MCSIPPAETFVKLKSGFFVTSSSAFLINIGRNRVRSEVVIVYYAAQKSQSSPLYVVRIHHLPHAYRRHKQLIFVMAAYLIDELGREIEAKRVRSLEGKDLHYTRLEKDVLDQPCSQNGTECQRSDVPPS